MDTAELVEKTLNILNETLEAAGEEMDKLRAKNTKLREALKKIENDWLTKSSPRERDYNELVAIASQALKEK